MLRREFVFNFSALVKSFGQATAALIIGVVLQSLPMAFGVEVMNTVGTFEPANSSSPPDESPAQPPVATGEATANKKSLVVPTQLTYQLKPELNYQYGIEMTSGDDGKGPWHLEGTVGYSLESSNPRIGSIMEQAKRQRQGIAEKSSITVRYLATLKGAPQVQNHTSSGTVSLTPEGEILSVDTQSDFSMIVASTSDLVFERLPPPNVNQWKAAEQRTCGMFDAAVIHAPTDVLNRLTRTGLIPWPNRYGAPTPMTINRTVISTTTIDDEMEYELIELDDAKAVVKSRLRSVMNFGGKIAGKIEGGGEYVFDRKQGVLTSKYADYKLRLSADGVELSVPFHLAFILKDALTPEEMKTRAEQSKREAEERIAKSRSEAAARKAKQQEEAAEKLDRAIATLKNASASSDEAHQALGDLALAGRELFPRDRLNRTAKADHPRKTEVSTVLDSFLKSDVQSIREQAMNAAEYWATATNIPALLEALESADVFKRRDIIKALGATGGNAKSAAVLARLLETRSRNDASRALFAM